MRFLNSVGGGIVKAFQGKQMILVEDESGFDFPALISECVVVGDVSSDNRPRRTAVAPTAAELPSTPPPEQKTAVKETAVKETTEGERLNVWLAFLPTDPKAMTQSRYEAFFINDSNFYLYYTFLSRSNSSWINRSDGQIEPNTKIFMEEFGKEDLSAFERVCVQLIAFKKDKPFALKNAVSVELRMDTVKFYKVHCFLENDFFDEAALLFPLIRADVPEKQTLISVAELQEAMQQKKQKDVAPSVRPTAKPKQAPPPTIEIDLHSRQLLDNTNGMSAGDILNYQLDKFREAMKQYAGNKGQKIIFIHGKGEGVLRLAIEKELKTHYKSCEYHDASFREYGFGATMVKIR